MFNRHTLLLSMLLMAAVIPYVSSSSDVRGKIAGLWASSQKQEPASTTSDKGQPPAAAGGQRPPDPTHAQPVTQPVYTPNEVLNFDVTPPWVLSHWPRVSAGLAELDVQGYRVSLITGTSDGDLAGSLTYYFDKQQRLERIGFHGTTGDPRALVTLVTDRYHLQRQSTDDPAMWLFQDKWNGKTRSELRIRPVSVVRSSVPRSRYEIEMTLVRPR